MAGIDQPIDGRVSTFDEERGLGTVTAEDGRLLGFHCTAVADGSRSIAVGSTVRFRVVPANLGTWEATGLTPR